MNRLLVLRQFLKFSKQKLSLEISSVHWKWSSLSPPRSWLTSTAVVSNVQLRGQRIALTGEHFTERTLLCCADPVLATDTHTCSKSLTARRQKRAKILGLKNLVPDSCKKWALLVTSLLLLPFLIFCSSSTIHQSIFFPPSLSSFFLTVPAHTHLSPLPRSVSCSLLSLLIFLL